MFTVFNGRRVPVMRLITTGAVSYDEDKTTSGEQLKHQMFTRGCF